MGITTSGGNSMSRNSPLPQQKVLQGILRKTKNQRYPCENHNGYRHTPEDVSGMFLIMVSMPVSGLFMMGMGFDFNFGEEHEKYQAETVVRSHQSPSQPRNQPDPIGMTGQYSQYRFLAEKPR